MLYSTKIKTTRDLRNNFSEVKRLLDDHDQIVITNNGKGTAVLINFEDYAKYEEYLREQYVLNRLDQAAKSLDDPNTKLTPHDEVWAALEKKWGSK